MISTVIEWLVVAVGLAMAGGTLLGLSRSPHWFVRGWDFPRLLIACLALAAGAVFAFWFFEGRLWEQVFLLATAATVVWQAYRIWPYTRTAPTQVKQSRSRSERRLSLVISNVQMQNREYERWTRVVTEPDPDLILAVEVDAGWVEALRPLRERYPHVVVQPQDNMYGMAVYSRRPLIDPEVRFVVDDAYPSIHAFVEMPDGTRVFFHGVHPAPPEPIRDQDSRPRDAELVVMAREVSDHGGPAIVAGDLNDVAWSHTTRLFQGISGMLDPRRGRGLYNTWPVAVPLCRVPLDHIFFSNCFTLVELRVLGDVGSDHFPVLVELQHEPAVVAAQPEAEPEPQQEVEAQEMIDRAEESTGRMVASRCRVASLFGFAHLGAKDERHGLFQGFPSYWNVYAYYAGFWSTHGALWLSAALLVVCTVLTVLPVRFVYPSLAPPPWRLPLLVGGGAWAAVLVAMLPRYPDVPEWLLWTSLAYPAFYCGVSVWLDARAPRGV